MDGKSSWLNLQDLFSNPSLPHCSQQPSSFASVCVCVCVCVCMHSVLFYSLWPHTRLLCLWNSPGKNTDMGFHSYFRESSLPRDRTRVSCVSCIGRWTLYHCKSLLTGVSVSTFTILKSSLHTIVTVILQNVIDSFAQISLLIFFHPP